MSSEAYTKKEPNQQACCRPFSNYSRKRPVGTAQRRESLLRENGFRNLRNRFRMVRDSIARKHPAHRQSTKAGFMGSRLTTIIVRACVDQSKQRSQTIERIVENMSCDRQSGVVALAPSRDIRSARKSGENDRNHRTHQRSHCTRAILSLQLRCSLELRRSIFSLTR